MFMHMFMLQHLPMLVVYVRLAPTSNNMVCVSSALTVYGTGRNGCAPLACSRVFRWSPRPAVAATRTGMRVWLR